MLKLIYYVPESHLEATKRAVFAAGAGAVGDYQYCAWQVKGIGQFMPLPQAKPYIGQADNLQQLEEWRVEIILAKKHAVAVKQALLEAHPYQTPAYEFIQLFEL